ncbi:hypothetical protein ADL01_18645, partial [Streptomyces sp. NRRL WC-3618]
MSKRTLDLVGNLIRRERNRLGTRWRKVPAGTQGLIVLAVLRHDQSLADMAGGNQVSASTVRRWVTEVLRLLGPVWSSDLEFGRSPARVGSVLISRQSWREAIS